MSTPIEITLDRQDFAQLDAVARKVYGVAMHPDALTHEQALILVAAYLRAFAEGAVSITTNGVVTATAALDGEAVRNAVEHAARDIAAGVDDDRPLYVRVEPTVWQRFTHCGPSPLRWSSESGSGVV